MKKKIFIVTALILVVVLTVSVVYYVNDYYRAEEVAVSLVSTPHKEVSVTEKDGAFIFEPEKSTAGIIFYPGGKVQAESYAPLMYALAEKGIMSALVTMPANLAVLDMNAADGIKESFKEISSWYMAGHSLGGSMAASYISENSAEYDGIILLASYSTADLSKLPLEVLSVYGSNDGVLNMEKYNEYKANLPVGFTEVIIEGGCHAYFGAYGEQEGDNKPAITRDEQINITVDE
ncbi:MAG: alpha/beta hydrolase, partial [Clostridia bacterium]|nr:alpha/beta hydrolase [Clostridia bacterium]